MDKDISRPPLIALTGGIGSGKSTALAAFARLGAAVLDCDRVVHELLRRDDVRQRVSERLGLGRIADGEAGRNMLAMVVFADPDKLDQLEAILHPLVLEEIGDWYGSEEVRGAPLAVVEIQMLFEAGMEDLFDARVFVTAPAAARRERMTRKMDAEEFDKRMSRQLPEEIKGRRCDYRYDNAAGTGELDGFVGETFDALTAGRAGRA